MKTYAKRLAEAEAYRAKQREQEQRRRDNAAQWLHTLYSSHKRDEGPLLIMAAVEAQ
jgi:hypothetical protein